VGVLRSIEYFDDDHQGGESFRVQSIVYLLTITRRPLPWELSPLPFALQVLNAAGAQNERRRLGNISLSYRPTMGQMSLKNGG
jgi:hypothetical protein